LIKCFQIATIDDSGAFIPLFIAIITGMDPVLLAFCQDNVHAPALPFISIQKPGPSSTAHKLVRAVARC
jgi:hypothetical protein